MAFSSPTFLQYKFLKDLGNACVTTSRDPSGQGLCAAGYVNFLRRISLEDPRQLSPADAAHHALLISSFRDTMQSSSSGAAAGRVTSPWVQTCVANEHILLSRHMRWQRDDVKLQSTTDVRCLCTLLLPAAGSSSWLGPTLHGHTVCASRWCCQQPQDSAE